MRSLIFQPRLRRPARHLVGACAVAIGAASGPAIAADVTLISGEVLEGEVTARTHSNLTLDHQLLGEVQIPLHTIALIDDTPLGDWLRSTDIALAAGPHAVLATNESDAPEVSGPSIDTDSDGSAEGEEQDITEEVKTLEVIADAQQGESPSDVEPPTPRPAWKYTIEFGLIGTQGNNEELNTRAGFKAERKSQQNRLAFDASYRFGTSRGDTSENKWTAGAISEWPFTNTPWTAFLQGRVESDEFASWDYRLTSGAGAQYKLLDGSPATFGDANFGHIDLTLRSGLGLRQEFGSNNDGLAPEGLLGAATHWEISPRTRINAETTLYPDLRDSGEFRLVSKADWTIDINHMDGVSFNIGIEHEYDSQVDPGLDHNDLRGYATVVVNF